MKTNTNSFKRRKRKCKHQFSFSTMISYIFILLAVFISHTTIVTATTEDTTSNSRHLISYSTFKFTNDHFTGYISENVATLKSYNSQLHDSINSRLNARTFSRSTHKFSSSQSVPSIYIRFVDLMKPSVRVILAENRTNCGQLSAAYLGDLELSSDSMDLDDLNIFELDTSETCFELNQVSFECECPLRIRLRDDSARDKLNREAKDTYNMQIKSKASSASIIVKILDDNDLEPMFDPSEYSIVLNESAIASTPAFTKIVRVSASDPDLSRNSLVRYFMNCNQFETSSMNSGEERETYANQLFNSCNKYFGVDWTTGDVYLKKSLEFIFDVMFDENGIAKGSESEDDQVDENSLFEKEFSFEIKAVDTGLKLNIANNLLLQSAPNSHRFRPSNRTQRRFKSFSDHEYDETAGSSAEDDDLDQNEANFKDDDIINYKLVKSAANLKITPQIKSISINTNYNSNSNDNRKSSVSYYGTSLEAALVRIKLVRDVLKKRNNFKFTKLTDLSQHEIRTDFLNEQIKFKLEKYSNSIIPFGLIETDLDEPETILIKSMEQPKLTDFRIEKLYLQSEFTHYLVYMQATYHDLIRMKQLLLTPDINSRLYSINKCIKNNTKCVLLSKFEFNLAEDLISIVEHSCNITVQFNENSIVTDVFRLSKWLSLNSALFKLNTKFNSIYSNDLCDIYLLSRNRFLSESLFHVEYEMTEPIASLINLNKHTGIAKLNYYSPNIITNKINVDANLYFKNIKMKPLNSNKFTINVELLDDASSYLELDNLMSSSPFHLRHIKAEANSIDSVQISFGPSDLIQENETIFKINLINKLSNVNYDLVYCSAKNCPFYLDKSYGTIISNMKFNQFTLNGPVLLIVRLDSDYEHLKYIRFNINYESTRFEKENCSIRVSLDKEQFQNKNSSSQINIFVMKMNLLNANENMNSSQEYVLTYMNEALIDKTENCILINPKSGNIFIKCQSLVFLKQYEIQKQFIVRVDYGQVSTYLNLSFDLDNSKNISDVDVFNCLSEEMSPAQVTVPIYNQLKQIVLKKIFNVYEADIKESKLKANTPIWQIDLKELANNDIQIEKVLQVNEEFQLIEDSSNLFKLNKQSGLLKLSHDWHLPLVQVIKKSMRLFEHELKVKLIKSNIVISLIMVFQLSETSVELSNMNKNNLPLPRLSQYNYYLNIDLNDLVKNQDFLLLGSIDTYLFSFDNELNVSDIYEQSYSIRLSDINSIELPFYIDSKGKLFYSNNNDESKQTKYDFNLVVFFKLNDITVHELSANCKVILNNNHIKQNSPTIKLDSKQIQINGKHATLGGNLDLSMSIISAEFISNLQCPLIGFLNTEKPSKVTFKLIKPKLTTSNNSKFSTKIFNKKPANTLRFNLSNNTTTIKTAIKKKKQPIKRNSANSMEEYIFSLGSSHEEDQNSADEKEKKLLIETFYSQLYLDENTGALYFNLNENNFYEHNEDSSENTFMHQTTGHSINQPYMYSKLAKLINYYLYEKNLHKKRVRVDAWLNSEDLSSAKNLTVSVWIDILFRKPHEQQSEPKHNAFSLSSLLNHENKFQINSNNLLNLFNNGDEFTLTINIEENNNHSDFLNLRKYFESKLDMKRNFINLKLIKQLEYYLVDLSDRQPHLSNEIFSIDESKSGILVTKPSIQFDYEVKRSYMAKIMIVQNLNEDEIDINNENNFLSQSTNSKFIYWLDLNINIINLIDEPLVCEQPIYYLTIDENEIKNKKLLTIKLKDYDSDESKNKVYKAQIVSGNTHGLFSMNELSLFTGSSSRKLDRETRAYHELDIQITETNEAFNSTRYASCRVVVNLNDINDNRPIINDIELVIYNNLDSFLINDMKIPIANAIAIDPDQISRLTYTISSVRYLTSNLKHKRNENSLDEETSTTGSDENITKINQSTVNAELLNLFYLNSSNGNLFATKSEMPCADCTILIQYRANDVGRLKTRVSRKSTIKLHIKPKPSFAENDQANNVTFDLALVNVTNPDLNQIILNVNEDTKLGEKLYQIKTKQTRNNEFTFVYFCLLDPKGELNQTFYMSNHDGALYLIKQLDYETQIHRFNLTVLVTNWLGQREYVYIQINLIDMNDNRPMFESSSIYLNEKIDLIENEGNLETRISLVNAYDLDDLDEGRLTFDIEKCFYMSKNILMVKKSIDSLCSKQFMSLVTSDVDWMNKKKQSISLLLNLRNLNSYLKNSSDLYLKKVSTEELIISFYIDVMVRDTSISNSAFVRINLDLHINNQPKLTNENHLIDQKSFQKEETNNLSIKFGFRKPSYFIHLKFQSDLNAKSELIRLQNEFVWISLNGSTLSKPNLFKPFELFFSISNKTNDMIMIEPNTGSIYLNSTDPIHDFVFKINIDCQSPYSNKLDSNRDSEEYNLFKSTQVIFSIESSYFYNNENLKDLMYYPVWDDTRLDAFIYENLPAGSWLSGLNATVFTAASHLSLKTISQIQSILPSLNVLDSIVYSLEQNDQYFEIDASTGFLRSKLEIDYETFKSYNLKLLICLTNLDQILTYNKICFKQTSSLLIKILNKNDNEPKIIKKNNELSLNFFNTTELIRSMSLFKFRAEDADEQLNSLRFKILHVKSIPFTSQIQTNKCSFNELSPSIEWFDLFQLDDVDQCIKLSDSGYESLIKLASKINHNHLNNCYFSIELTVSVSDGLFSNQKSLYLNLLFDDTSINQTSTYSSLLFIKNGLVVPVLNSIELTENINTNSSENLVNLNDLVSKYLSSNHVNISDQIRDSANTLNDHFKYELRNYENIFLLNQTDKMLCIKKQNQFEFDRETRDTYELFIMVKIENDEMNKYRSLIPTQFRILIKLIDYNDNAPKFYLPSNTKYLKENLYELRRTLKWSDLISSNKTNPFLTVKANDIDIGINSLIKYELVEDTDIAVSFIKVNERTGAIYLNTKLNSSFLWNKYSASDDEFHLMFSIQAIDQSQSSERLKSILNVKLVFINLNENATSNVYFNQTYYEFRTPESTRPGAFIGFVDSICHFNRIKPYQLVYSIVDGDEYNQFEINYQTGALHSRLELDYEIKSVYFIIVSIHNTFNPDYNQHSNATVQINIINVNDNEPRFDKYEYEVEIKENLEKMSEIFRLNASDIDNAGEETINYQLLNHLDKFYIDEQTGIIYNKITFDFEEMRNEAGETNSTSTQHQQSLDSFYNSFEYLNSIQLKIRAYDQDMLETFCILTIKITNVNDNPPQFERAFFSSHIQVNEDDFDSDIKEASSDENSIMKVLLDESTSETSTKSVQFVTKISAKDVDSKTLYYSILKQTQIDDDDSSSVDTDRNKLNRLAVNNLFFIENQTGIVYISLEKYKLLRKFNQFMHSSKQTRNKQLTTFSLQLSVTDSMLTTHSRLTVQVESLASDENRNTRPLFKSNIVTLNVNITKLNLKKAENVSILNVNKNLAVKHHHISNSYIISLNLDHLTDLFSIKANKYLYLNVKKFNDYLKLNIHEVIDYSLIYQIPITVCNPIQTGLCDQMIAKINLTDLFFSKKKEKLTNETRNEFELTKISFAYNYGSVTIQQQTNTPIATAETDLSETSKNMNLTPSSSEDDYYLDYNYESNERFYYEIKANNLFDDLESADIENKVKFPHFEFELFSCVFSSLNVSFTNSSIGKQIKQFTNHNNLFHAQPNHHRLTLQQLKSLFSLNKHNGVLSSRKVINSMLPGVYMFNIRIKTNSSHSAEAPFEILDSMTFKLIILPPNNFLKANCKTLYNYFKFNREYYKFRVDKVNNTAYEVGQIKLINKFQPPKYMQHQQQSNFRISSFKIEYKLIESKHIKPLLSMFDLNANNGQLTFKIENASSIEYIKPYLKNENEFVVYALASVSIENNNNSSSRLNNTLEYMCEIIIDFKSLLSANKNEKNSHNHSKNQLMQLEKNGEFIRFGSIEHSLKIIETIRNLNISIYRFIAFMHTTERNLSIQYSIEFDSNQEKMKDYFRIEHSTGLFSQLREHQAEKDNSIEKIINFKVKACVVNELALVLNQIECALTHVKLELANPNDSPPKFEQSTYNQTIREDDLPGTVVLTVNAFDSDMIRSKGQLNRNIEYFILDGDSMNQFAVSSDGKVYTRLMIDRELKRFYSLVVMAFDGHFKSLAKLNIEVLNVNDNRPQCTPTLVALSLSESLSLGSTIYTVDSHDPDGTALNYEIITKEENDLIDQVNFNRTNSRSVREQLNHSGKQTHMHLPFSVNEKTGSIQLSDSLDYEMHRFYSFYVRVIKNSNQEQPTNEIQNKHNFPLKSTSYALRWSSYCLVKFEIKVSDENDNRPEFTPATYSVDLVENSMIGSLISQVKANDIDSPKNSVIKYSLLDNAYSHLFKIDSKLGLITLNSKILDRELLGDSLVLALRASDSTLFSDSSILINLMDVNDNIPVFPQREIYLRINENMPIGSQIVILNATDSDFNSTIQYFLADQSDSGFLVDKINGSLTVNTILDYETKANYVVYVKAFDPLHSNNPEANASVVKLIIDLIDMNDNVPQFNILKGLSINVDENILVNTTITTVNAFDLDSTSPNNQLEFEIINGNYLGYFAIEKTTGKIYNKILFDYELLKAQKNGNIFEITVECRDKGSIPTQLMNQTLINIQIRDINDNSPVFLRINQTFVIRENIELNSEIARLKVSDSDTVGNGGPPFSYEIIEQYRTPSTSDSSNSYRIKYKLYEPYFIINNNGSLILIKKPVRDQIFIVQVRCTDSGKPPLSSDTYLTVKITDEWSHEPQMNKTSIEIITIGSLNEYESVNSLIKVTADQIIGQLRAIDPDIHDLLNYELSSSDFSVEKTSGVLRSKKDLIDTASFSLRPTVSDNKFITEADLNIHVNNVNTDCFSNSLFVKFNVWSKVETTATEDTASISSAHSITLDQFYQYGYMKRFKEMIIRMLNTNKNTYEFGSRLNSYNKSNILIIGLRHVDLNSSNHFDEANLEPQMHGSIVEILFSIRKNLQSSYRDESSECLDSKLISKMLNKRRSTLIKRMRTPLSASEEPSNGNVQQIQQLKFKLIDLSFNSQCKSENNVPSSGKGNKLISVCTTNVALQNCLLKFKSYFESRSLCEQEDSGVSKCYLTPRYEWNCETGHELNDPETTTNKLDNSINFISKVVNQNRTKLYSGSFINESKLSSNPNENQQKYGSSCKKPFNPCKNNAICKQVRVASISTTKKSQGSSSNSNYKVRVHCFCPNGFRGPFCEDDIDECDLDGVDAITNGPCIPEAKCQNTYGSYICNCSSHPPSACYNTLSPQYSASTVDKKTAYLLKNHKYSNYVYSPEKKQYIKIATKSELELLNESEDTVYVDNDTDDSDYLLFGSIPTSTVRQALLGVFGAVCGILIILTFAAAIICKMNMSRRRLKKRYLRAEHETNNEKMSSLLEATHMESACEALSDNNIASFSSAGDVDRSSISSPSCSLSNGSGLDNLDIINKIPPKPISTNNSKHKQRQKKGHSSSIESSMSHDAINGMAYGCGSSNVLIKTSTQSTTGGASLTGDESPPKANTNAALLSSGSQATSSICESLASSIGGTIPQQQPLNNDDSPIVEATTTHMFVQDDNLYDTAINEYDLQKKQQSLVSKTQFKTDFNGMSSFGRDNIGKKNSGGNNNIEMKLRESFYKYDSICSLTNKDKSDSVILLNNLDNEGPFKYNTTSSVRTTPNHPQNNYFSLMPAKSRTPQHNKTTTSTFVPIQNKQHLEIDEIDDSMHTAEDNTQGFYWDITDWASGNTTEIDLRKKLKKSLNIRNKPDLPNITSHLPQLIMHQLAHASSSSQTLNNGNSSPIYSRNYKTFRNKVDQEDLHSSISNDDHYLKESTNLNEINPNEISINLDYISSTITNTNQNYMYLIDSNTLSDQTLDDNNHDDHHPENTENNRPDDE